MIGQVALSLLLASSVVTAAEPWPAGTESASAGILEGRLAAHTRFLSHKALEGRGPGSRGDRLARLYIATEMERLGLLPAAPGGRWDQPFVLVGVETRVPPIWSFRGSGPAVTLDAWDEFVASSGVQSARAGFEDAPVVFVGYGIQAPEYDWDDYKGADLRGKVLLMLNDDPDWDPDLFGGGRRLYYGRWDYKYESAARQGAAGAILIHTTPSAGYPWSVVQNSWKGEQFELPAEGEPRVQVTGWVTEQAARRIVALGGHELDALVRSARDRDFRPVPLGIRISLSVEAGIRTTESANVLGVLPGSDPHLSREAVVYTAHHDHLGAVQAPDGGREIFHGARDNALAVAMLLEVARAFTALPEPPRRTILFLAPGAEEQGLLGSEHYTRNPTFHPARLAANINFEMPNIWGRTRDVPVIGFGKSTLDDAVRRAAAAQGRTVVDERFPDRGYFYRSDQFSFARIGVPAVWIDTGTDFVGRPDGWGKAAVEAYERERYHKPADVLDETWNLAGAEEDAVLAFLAGLAIAQEEEMPRWTSGDEFEAVRQRALSDLGPPS
jgi:Zn-dependent M28 family amino/carboxypeptidase